MMGNGLLVGLVEYWSPVSGVMKGRHVGLDMTENNPVSFINEASFPGGKGALFVNDALGPDQTLYRAANALFDCSNGFLASQWCKPYSFPPDGSAWGQYCHLDGVATPDWTINPATYGVAADFDFLTYDNGFSYIQSSLLVANTTYLICCGFDINSGLAVMYLNGIAIPNIYPSNPPDSHLFPIALGSEFTPDGSLNFDGLLGDTMLWTGASIPDAAQVSALYGAGTGLDYSQFDSGGGGGPVGAQTVLQGVDFGNSKYGIRR